MEQFEEEQYATYITSFERIGLQQGLQRSSKG